MTDFPGGMIAPGLPKFCPENVAHVQESNYPSERLDAIEVYRHIVQSVDDFPLTRWAYKVRDSFGNVVAEGCGLSESGARDEAQRALDNYCDEETATVGEPAEAVTPEDRRKLIEKRLREVLQGLRPAEAEAIRQGYLKASAGLWELQSALSAHSDGPLGMELGSVKAARAIFDLLHLGNIV